MEESPFLLQSVVEELYFSQDLLDLTSPDASAPPAGSSLFGAASHIASAAARRATSGVTGSSPTKGSPGRGETASPDRARGVEAASASGKEIRCVEGYGPNLYIGFSDGTVEWWVCDGGAGTSKAQGWTMRHKHTLFPRRPVSSIVVVPKVAKMLVVSGKSNVPHRTRVGADGADGTMHALALPSLEGIPSTTIPPLRGVSSIILDDNEMEWAGPGGEERNAEVIVVVVRRRGLGIYRLGERMQPVKEIPLPTAPTSHALTHTYLCAAIPTSGTYSLIDLSDASLTEVLPISQVDAESLDWDPVPNVVVIPGADEFLVTSYTGVGTMGVFLNGQGDPVRGTMEWEEHPLSIAIDSGYIIALLRNHSIVIHALNDLEKPVQTIPLDPKLKPFRLSYSPYGVSIRDATRDARLGTSAFRLLGGQLGSQLSHTEVQEQAEDAAPANATALPDDAAAAVTDKDTDAPESHVDEPMGGSGLTPPSSPPQFPRQPITPKRQASLLQSTAPPTIDGPFSTCVAETLIIGPNGIMSLAPTPVILKVEQLCRDRNMDAAIVMVDEERRKGRRGEVDADKATHQGTVRFLHLYLALQLFANGLFERAGEYLSRGKIDPRLIVRSYPELRGKLIGSEEEVDVYDGLRDVLQDIPSVSAIVKTTVKRNFAGNDDSAPDAEQEAPVDDNDQSEERAQNAADQAAEAIRSALSETAYAMLSEFLTKTRQSRRKGGGSRGVDSRKIETVIDTVLAKLLATSGSTNDLLALLAAPNDCVLSEVEPFLQTKPYVLATVLRKQGRHARVLELLKQIAESEITDPLCPDPVAEIALELDNVRDPDTVRQYALWLISRDVDRGISLLIAQSGAKVDHEALVRDIRAVSEEGANRYLEHVVVGRKSPNRTLHRDLLDRLLTRLEKEVSDEGIRYHLEELDAEYRMLADPEPFCVFIADFAPKTPVKETRLKTMLFLQGSPFYNLQEAEERLAKVEQLKYERAIVLGKLGRSRQALQLLAREVSDSVSAQTFCTQDGEVIPPRVANRVAQCVPELAAWAALCEVGRGPRDAEKVVDAATQQGLVMELLGVYMRDGASTSKETAALLNAQSRHLDTLKVLDMVPPSWPVDVIASFTQRALRRQLHDRCSVAILKSIAAGQNLQVAEEYLDAIRSVPAYLQEADRTALPPTNGQIEEKSPGIESEKSTATYTTTTSSGDAEKPLNGAEGSVADNGTDGGGRGGKEGFFSPEIVDKELRRVERRLSRARSRGEE